MNLLGLHDWSPDWAQMVRDAGMTGWCVTTHALSEQASFDFREMAGYGITPIARLNFGYGSTGTIPTPDRYADFARRCADFVAASPGCQRWIIANEMNHSQERPQGQPILPEQYADCYRQCRAAIHAIADSHEVIMGAVAPWNVETTYPANPSGDWLLYMAEILAELMETGIDGISIHGYTHGADPSLITSTATMDPPYEDRYYHFLAYQDLLAAVPPALSGVPVYLTETDQDVPWTDVNDGWIQRACMEIDGWNRQSGQQQIHCLCCYRWAGDQWALEGKTQRLADFAAAVALGIQSPPRKQRPPIEVPEMILPGKIPRPPTGATPTPPEPKPDQERALDPSLSARGVTYEFAVVPAGVGYWRLIAAHWLDEQEADQAGPDHHILGNVYRQGAPAAGIPFYVSWPSGDTIITSKPPSTAYNYDYPMSPSLNEFSIRVSDGNPSDSVAGIGMGVQGNPKAHTSTWLDWEWTIGQGPEPTPGEVRYGTVTAPAGLNIRAEPTTDSAILAALPYGTGITIDDEADGWYHIGPNGWVSGDWVQIGATQPQPPALPPVPPRRSEGQGVVTPPEPTPPPGNSQANFERSMEVIFRFEGGYQNDPNDIGNWTGCEQGVGVLKGTNYGISACSYPDLDIVNLTQEQAKQIYYRDYWGPSGAAGEPWPDCLCLFDTSVLHGVGTATSWWAESREDTDAFLSKRLNSYCKSSNWGNYGLAWTRRVAELMAEMGE